MQLISGEKDWNHVSVQKVVTLNTCCDVGCLAFQLPHITTGSSKSHFQQYYSYILQIIYIISEVNKLLSPYPPHLKIPRDTNVWRTQHYLQSDEKVLHFTK